MVARRQLIVMDAVSKVNTVFSVDVEVNVYFGQSLL